MYKLVVVHVIIIIIGIILVFPIIFILLQVFIACRVQLVRFTLTTLALTREQIVLSLIF